MVDYLKDNFLLGREFADLADMNAQGRHWLDYTANVRIHATTHERPVDLLPRENLIACSSIEPYPVSSYAKRQVNAESFVHFEGSRYSAPPEHVGKKVVIIHQGSKVVIHAGNLIIAEHDAATKTGSSIVNPKHIADLWKLTTNTDKSKNVVWFQNEEPIVEIRALSVYEEAAA
jgi:hypothetical protein